MTRGLGGTGERRDDASHRTELGGNLKEIFMTWQTPTATDFRFGFEITMYVAAR